jgi:hypothetical protein
MTGSVIKPVVIPATPLRHDGQPTGPRSGPSAAHRTLPLPTVPTPRASAAVYGLAAVEAEPRGERVKIVLCDCPPVVISHRIKEQCVTVGNLLLFVHSSSSE